MNLTAGLPQVYKQANGIMENRIMQTPQNWLQRSIIMGMCDHKNCRYLILDQISQIF